MLVRARDFWGPQNILGYSLHVLGQYYLEESLKCKTMRRVLFDDLALIAVQNFGMLLLFLPFQGRFIWRKDALQAKHLAIGRPHSTKRKSPTKKSAPQKIATASASAAPEPGPAMGANPKTLGKKIKGTKQKKKRLNETLKKVQVLGGMCVLSLMGVLSRIIFFKTLEHTSYPVICIVKAFRLFPGTAEVMPLPTTSRRVESELESMLGTFLTTVGIFVYVFAEEEEEHDRVYLKKNLIRLSSPDTVFPDTISHKIIRLGLGYLRTQARSHNGEPTGHPASARVFLQAVLAGDRPDMDITMTIQEQIRAYYHEVILEYSGCSVHPADQSRGRAVKGARGENVKEKEKKEREMAKQLLECLNKHKKTRAEKRRQQVFAGCILRTLLRPEESPEKLALFLEHRKIKAAIFLAAHFWAEAIKEGTQTLFIKKYRMENTSVQHGVSMVTGIMCWLVLFLNGYDQKKVAEYANVIVFLSLFSFSQTLRRKQNTSTISPPQQIGMKVGRKILSVLFSSILHDHQFTATHAIGLFLLFAGSLLNESIYAMVYSKWTFRDNLIKKPL